MSKPTIVILGGGFGGVRAALDLEKFLPDAEIFLVDKNSYHTYTSDLYELAAAEFSKQGREDILGLTSTLAVPFQEIFSPKRVRFLKGEALDINFKKKEVILDFGRLRYDYLVLALGSQTNFFTIPHLGEKALELKSASDALNIKSALEELFQTHGKHEKISVVIGGGGFTGSELAGELGVALPKLARKFSHPVQNIYLTLVEGSDQLLYSAHPWFHGRVMSRLEKLGVKIMLGSFITDIHDGEVILKNKPAIKYHLLIWTAGVKANRLVEKVKGVKLEKNKCIMVGRNMEVPDLKNVFVIGDLAYCGTQMTAQAAIEQGHYVAEFLASKLGGRPYPDYHPKISRFVVPLGGKYALADLGFIKISGFPAWFLKRFVALKYFLTILPPAKAFRLWWQGLRIFTQND